MINVSHHRMTVSKRPRWMPKGFSVHAQEAPRSRSIVVRKLEEAPRSSPPNPAHTLHDRSLVNDWCHLLNMKNQTCTGLRALDRSYYTVNMDQRHFCPLMERTIRWIMSQNRSELSANTVINI